MVIMTTVHRGFPSFERFKASILAVMLALPMPITSWAAAPIGNFDPDRDLFLAQFDSKTDADDIHSVAGVGTMLRDPRLANVNYHAVAGAYGIQEGLYIPSPQLFNLVFGERWSDAHNHRERSVKEVAQLVTDTLAAGGDIWVAEAGQSDFTADWLKEVNEMNPDAASTARVHVVQHSDWNESVTAPDKLAYVRKHADYRKIADGNATGNGTPGFRLESAELWQQALDPGAYGEFWALAKEIADAYNGKDGRYDNGAIAAGGMDFSDVAETCWIFGFTELEDARAFFEAFPGQVTGDKPPPET